MTQQPPAVAAPTAVASFCAEARCEIPHSELPSVVASAIAAHVASRDVAVPDVLREFDARTFSATGSDGADAHAAAPADGSVEGICHLLEAIIRTGHLEPEVRARLPPAPAPPPPPPALCASA